MAGRTATGAEALRDWLSTAAAALEEVREPLDALNVFPVADADTGGNLAATVRAGADAARLVGTSLLGELLGICAQHCLEEARGNSGTLLAVMLAGMAEPLTDTKRLSAPELAAALDHAWVRVTSALNDPVEGTIWTLVRTVAEASEEWVARSTEEPDSHRGLVALLEHLVEEGCRAVAASGEQLEVLRGTGRVDAGALGVLIVLDCLSHTVAGKAYPGAPERPYGRWLTTPEPADRNPSAHPSRGPATDPDAVEFMCTIALDPLAAATVRHELTGIGDSVIMTAIDPTGPRMRWKVHVHVGTAAEAMAVLTRHGRPTGITTETLAPGERS